MTVEARFRHEWADVVPDAEPSLPSRGVTALFGCTGAVGTLADRDRTGVPGSSPAGADERGRLVRSGR